MRMPARTSLKISFTAPLKGREETSRSSPITLLQPRGFPACDPFRWHRDSTSPTTKLLSVWHLGTWSSPRIFPWRPKSSPRVAMRSILGASVIQPIRFVEYSACGILWTRCEPAAMSGAVRRRLRLQTAMHLTSILIPGWRVDLDPRTILPLMFVRSLNVEPVDCDSWFGFDETFQCHLATLFEKRHLGPHSAHICQH